MPRNYWTRREGLVGILGLTVAGCGSSSTGSIAATGPSPGVSPSPDPTPGPTPSPTPTPSPGANASINAAAEERNMRFGSTYAWSRDGADAGSFANPDYAALLEADCGILVPENELKWQAIEPKPGEYAFARFDDMLAYASAHAMPVRGHNLLWHQTKWLPGWVRDHDFGSDPEAEAKRLLGDHIKQVMRRYSDSIDSWDVVNEAVDNDDGSYYETALSDAIGGPEATLDFAFRTAREEAPDAQLVYNDYMSWEPGNAKHRDGVLKLLKGFKDRGVPVDALGVQSHIGVFESGDVADLAARYAPDWRDFLDRVVAMGYDLLITEFDVRGDALPTDAIERDRGIATYGRAYLDLMFEYPQLGDVLAWGMCDKYSWLQNKEPRDDGAAKRPCPYDADFRAKPLHGAIVDAFEAADTRSG